MNSLGIYEKALPKNLTWDETLNLCKELGFNFFEMSIDESDERLKRLYWTESERKDLKKAIGKTGVRIHTLMLSGHRRYPLGSLKEEIRNKSVDMLARAVDLASDLGIRNIQLAGYDVYYEPKSVQTRNYFMEGLSKIVALAAKKQVMLSIETMDDPFINSLSKVHEIKSQIHSPWLQAYPDLGNLTAWLGTGIAVDLEKNIDNIVAVHLKDTLPVTSTYPGKFKNVPFGEGTVDFEGCLSTLKRLNYSGSFTIEMWSQESDNPIEQVKESKKYFDRIFKNVGITQEK